MKKSLICLFSVLLISLIGCKTKGDVDVKIIVNSPPVVVTGYWPTYYYCHPWWGWGYWHQPHYQWMLVPRPHFHSGPFIEAPPHMVPPPPCVYPVPTARPPGPPVMKPGRSYHPKKAPFPPPK